MGTQQQRSKDARALVEEELKRIGAGRLSAASGNASAALQASGIVEILAGAAALFSPVFAGVPFVMLMGGAVVISGAVNVIASFVQASAGRFALGGIGMIGGMLIVAHPLFGLAFLAALVGAYLIGTGLARFIEPRRTALSVVNGIVGVVFGVVILLSLPDPGPVLMGLLVGINLIINGINLASTGIALRMPLPR